jgi:hypothetical protein
VSGSVFISYRREDSGAWADRIRNRLRSMLGSDRVVLDIDDIAHGPNFASALTERVNESDAVVMIIGKNWHTKTLADPNDRVRIEIEAALNRKIRITPVLVDGASMPQPGDLPESLKALTHMRPIDLSSEHFDADMKRLEEALHDLLSDIPKFTLPNSEPITQTALGDSFEWSSSSRIATKPKKAEKKSADKKRPARKAAAKKSARKVVAKKATRRGAAKRPAGKKAAAKKSAAKTSAPRKAAARKTTRKPANKNAGRSASAARRPARRVPVNPDLSVDKMKELASARRSAAPPETDHPHARSGNAKSADSVKDNVECSVFGPSAAPPGGTVLIQVFLHLANQAEHASFLAGAMDASAKLKGTRSLDLAIKRGARVEIALSANGLVVDEPVQSVVWRGEPAFCQFLATIPAGTSGQSFFPVVRVSVDGKLVGPIKFRPSSDATASRPVSEPLGDHAGPYKYAFVSYATKDRKEVLKRLQMLEVMKTKFFQDILSIEAGDRWKKKLYQNIDRCDLFLLFWSQAAKDSEWVIKEAEYALAHQRENPHREPDLVPVVLEQNVPPPPSLSAFQFNDRIGYLISLTP